MLTIRSITSSAFFTMIGFCAGLAYQDIAHNDALTLDATPPARISCCPPKSMIATNLPTQPNSRDVIETLWSSKEQAILIASAAKENISKLAGLSFKVELKKANQILAVAKEAVLESKKGEELDRLWLQSYNAGPGSLLRYRGNVPYRETRLYVKKVMTYYNQDLSGNPYDEKIRASARQFNLDPQMVRAIAKAESDFNPKCVSSAGARGVMQVMGCTWAHAKKVADIPWSYGQDVFDPQKNIYVACAYLSWLRHDFIPHNANKLGFYPPKLAPVNTLKKTPIPQKTKHSSSRRRIIN